MATPGTTTAPYLAQTTKSANANIDTWLPAGRTVANMPAYLANNAVFNVKDFGAVGDGIADDTAVIQAVITAAASAGGVILLPVGSYLVTTPLILSGGITLQGSGCGLNSSATSRILWPSTSSTNFCIQMGNSGSGLVQGVHVRDLSIYASAGGHGIKLYGICQSSLRNVDIEGNPAFPTSIGVQIDGANISTFFNLMENVKCNHVLKGFVHTTSGTQPPTQNQGINCSAYCDNTTGSIGVDIQNVAGTGCGDGAIYVGGNMEQCKIGVSLNGSGTTLVGMRFENQQGVASDITLAALARNNNIMGCVNVYTLTDAASSYTNQIIATSKDQTNVISQMNKLDALTLGENAYLTPSGTAAKAIYVNSDNTYTGKLFLQAGGGSAGFGASVTMYGHAHATHPGDYVAGISSGSGGKFRVNSQGQDGGTDWLVVDGAAGISTILGFLASSLTLSATASRIIPGATSLSLRNNANNADNLLVTDAGAATVRTSLQVTTGFGCNGSTPQTAATGMAALATYGAGANGFDTAGHAQEIHDKLNTILAALRANGIGTT